MWGYKTTREPSAVLRMVEQETFYFAPKSGMLWVSRRPVTWKGVKPQIQHIRLLVAFPKATEFLVSPK